MQFDCSSGTVNSHCTGKTNVQTNSDLYIEYDMLELSLSLYDIMDEINGVFISDRLIVHFSSTSVKQMEYQAATCLSRRQSEINALSGILRAMPDHTMGFPMSSETFPL